jgi:hypothetical protein
MLNTNMVRDIRQKEPYTTESLVLDSTPFEVETDNTKLKSCMLTESDQIPTEQIKPAGGQTLWYETYKLIHDICNDEELRDQWKKSFIVSIYKMGEKTALIIMDITVIKSVHNCIYNIILHSRLRPYVDEINGDHQRGFWCNRSTIG